MKKVLTLLTLPIVVAGCVQLEINPGNVVADTVNAGKDAYQSIKRYKNGEEQRAYSHAMPYDDSASTAENTTHCKAEIYQIIKAASYTVSNTISESSKVIKEQSSESISCTIEVVVRKSD